MTTILFFLAIGFYAKPLYWLVKATYLHYKGETNNLYHHKLLEYIKQTWELTKWQKADL